MRNRKCNERGHPSQIEGNLLFFQFDFFFLTLKLVSSSKFIQTKEMGMDSSVIIVCKEVSYL